MKITSVSLKFEPHIKAYLSISLDRIIVLTPQLHFMFGSNFYEADVSFICIFCLPALATASPELSSSTKTGSTGPESGS